ncbi:hypothetical protein [Nostoc sp.]|uniref:hypothetical protein n=1 Tax=Nostoc sp. TaxID=1180 RepID=UPI002FF5B167
MMVRGASQEQTLLNYSHRLHSTNIWRSRDQGMRCLRRTTFTLSLDNKLGDRIKLSNPQLTIRVSC